ncbi:MAG: hypothetical protein ACP5T3_00025 [Candidatus Micrarchaeia archaeon]
MIDAIVTALESNSVVVTPTEDVDFAKLVGRSASYTDSSDKKWPGKVTAAEDSGVVIIFDNFPTGLGQGQIVQIDY